MKSGLSWLLCVVIFFTTLRSEAAPRVALMDFSTDDNSYRSAQTAADFTSLLQVQLVGESGVEWVERAQLDKARQELELSTMELMDGGSSIRQGKWVKADWMITGQFSLDDQNHRSLFLEITDLQHADVLVSRTITFQDAATAQFQTASNQVNVAAAAFRQLLTEAHLRQQQTVDKILVAPLFLADVTRNGFSRGNGVLQQGFDDALQRAVATNSRVRLIRFPKAYRSIEESEMVLDGLVEADRNAWQQTADLYVWGTYAVTRKTTQGKFEQKLEIDLHIWDGVSEPAITKEELPYSWSSNTPPDQLEAALNRLVNQVITHAHKSTTQIESASIRKEISTSLVETYDQMTLRFHRREELGLNQPEQFAQAIQMLETACFFDPDNANARLLYITCRWGSWMNFTFKVKNEFWSKWRGSQAWRKYVDRFGLKPVQNQEDISGMYVGSLEAVAKMFPQWHSPEEMALEDEWRRQGVHTWLMEAEGHGFPKEMPHELAMKWKTDIGAELVRRKQMVAEYAQSNSAITNNGAGNAISAVPPAPVVPRPQQISTPQTSSQMVPTPLWSKDMQAFYSMFRLFPPNALPLEVQPNMQEIRFPKQFEVQKIGQLDFLDDKLLILAMDERSSPSSDNNPDVSAEILDKHNRLWVLKPGEENPILYEANLFPQSINAFLLEGDRLWVAGKTTGYLNLKTHNFRKFGLADGFDLPTSDALGFAGGHIFAAGDNFKVSMFDAAQDRWSNLSLPPANLSGGTGSPFLLAGSRQWLGYVAGSVLIRDFTHNTWTNLANINSIEQILADDSGFWFGGWDGLHLYEPASKSLKHWNAPTTLNGLFVSMMGTSFMGNSEISKGSLERVDGQIQGLLTKFRGNRAKNHATKRERNTGTDPLHLDWRLPGEVTAFANDGEFLWVGVGNYFGDYLLLLHKPSESVVAYCPMRVRDHISSLAVSRTSVWIGTAYGDHQLLQFPRDTFTSVPRSRWVSLAVAPEERERLIRSMSVRDQAMYAFYASDDARVTGLLGDTNPEKASLETMMLLAFSYDTLGLDKPEQSRFWFEQIISRYPDSPWAKTAQTALSENEQNHKEKAHEANLLLKFDRNHDGILDEIERRAMEKDSDYQREEKDRGNEQLNVQLQKIMQRFDLNTDNKLDRGELESLRNQVVMFSEAPSEMLSGRKILVAPLMTKNFPAISNVLKKYDVNGDGALDSNELMALAQDIKQVQ